jgi:glycosyltransferase involved in cell wall biosynthesis
MNKPKRLLWLYARDHTKHPFIRLAADTLAEAGFKVTVLDMAPRRIKTKYRHLSLFLPWHRVLGQSKHGYSWFESLLVKLIALVFRPKIIIATLPMPLYTGWKAAKMLGARLVYYPFELFGEQDAPVPEILKKREIQVLSQGVDAVITQNEERAKIYVQERKSRVRPVIVHNYKKRETAAPSGKLRTLLKLPPNIRIVLYEGILNKGRCLDQLVKAAAYLPEDTRLVLMGEKKMSWWMPVLEPLLKDSALADKVMVAPFIPHEDLLPYVADADVGILIYDGNSRNSLYCEPGKLSDYVFAGVPVAASRLPTLEPVIRRLGIGETFTNPSPQDIAQAINSVLSVPKANWKNALEKAREELAWETQVGTFLKAVSGEQG